MSKVKYMGVVDRTNAFGKWTPGEVKEVSEQAAKELLKVPRLFKLVEEPVGGPVEEPVKKPVKKLVTPPAPELVVPEEDELQFFTAPQLREFIRDNGVIPNKKGVKADLMLQAYKIREGIE